METYLHDLVQLQKRQFSVNVLVANDKLQLKRELSDQAVITRVVTFGSIASMPICPFLPWHIANVDADIVHLHMPNPGAALAFLMSGHKGKVVITHHGDTLGRTRLRKLSDPFVRRLMDRAEAIIVSSSRYRDSSRELSAFHRKCRVIPLGIDPKTFENPDPSVVRQIKSRYGNRIVLSVGRLVPYKGMRYLIETMRSVDANLIHIGTGPLNSELTRLANEIGVSSKIQFLGQVEDLSPYLRAANMLVLPSISRAESFGIVQLEAMAAGIPVINTDIDSGVPEVSLHNVTGLTVPPKDHEALGYAINLLLDNPGMQQKFGRAGRLRVCQEFSIERMVDQTVSLYQQILK
jgi:glycosyltransferase involved in cell wall biosynthesis